MVRVAAAQYASPLLDAPAAADIVADVLRKAGRQGVSLTVFSEGFVGGHPDWLYFLPGPSPRAMELGACLIETALTEDGPEVRHMAEAAREAGSAAVVGVALKDSREASSVYNALLFFDQEGNLSHVHRKLVPTTTERLVHTPGDAAGLRGMRTSFGMVTGLVCGENSNSLARFACVMESPAVHAMSWSAFFSPSSAPMPEVTDFVARSMAYEAGSFVVSTVNVWTPETVARLGLGPDALEHASNAERVGGSSVYSPRGELLARARPGAVEELVVADINLAMIPRKRLVHDTAGHYNRPDIFELRVRRGRPRLMVDAD